MAHDLRLRRRNHPAKRHTADAICRRQAKAEVSSVKQSEEDGDDE